MAGFFQPKEKTVNRVVLLPVSEIVPNPAQPRLEFEEEALRSLADSIAENGVLQTILVRRIRDHSYELISGERRWRATKLLGRETIPAVILDATSRQSAIFAILENIQRKDLNLFEEAAALQCLMVEWGVTQEEAASKLGMAQSTIANKLRLLAFSEEEQQLILAYGLSERHARTLLRLRDDPRKLETIHWVGKHHLTVRQTEAYVEKLLSQKKLARRVLLVKDIRIFLNTINQAIDTMKSAGIQAESQRVEHEEYIEYLVRIPTAKGKKLAVDKK